MEPQVEQWVAWGNVHLIDLTSSLYFILDLPEQPCQEKALVPVIAQSATSNAAFRTRGGLSGENLSDIPCR